METAVLRTFVTELLRSSTLTRFIVAGVVNTVFGFLVYGTAILAGAPVWVALLVGVVAGIGFNFFTVGGYAFRQLAARRFPRFAACYALTYAINLGLFRLLSQWLAGEILVQALLSFPMAAVSYLLMRMFVFPTSSAVKS